MTNDSNQSPSAENKTLQIEKDIRSGERWLIGITTTGVILNAIIALIYFGQLGEMRKATVASTKSADAATSAADTAGRALRLDERAWVTARIVFPEQLKVDDMIRGDVVFTNSGKTIGKPIVFKVYVDLLNINTPPQLTFAEGRIINKAFIPFIEPHPGTAGMHIFRFTAHDKPELFSRETIDALNAGTKYLVIFGQAEYQDIFNDWHWIKFCEYKSYMTKIVGFPSIPAGRCATYSDIGDGKLFPENSL